MLQFKQGGHDRPSVYTKDSLLFRLRKLQKVVAKTGIDAILIINGVDSKRNEENEKVTKWLIGGLSGLEVLNSYMAEIFDELVLVVTPDQAIIHAERPAYDYLLPYLTLPGVQVFLNEHEDQDTTEVEKIGFFLRAIKGLKKIGMIPARKDKGNVKNIEKWPLLQAYSLEGTNRGYFAQQHSIINVGVAVNELYKHYDRHALEKVIRRGEQLNYSVQRVRNEYIKVRARDLHKYTSETLSTLLSEQSQLEELTENIKELVKPWTRPYLEKDDEQGVIRIENVDICTKLRVARTYFQGQNVKQQIDQVEKDIDEETDQVTQYRMISHPDQNYSVQDNNVCLYLQLVQAYKQVVNELAGAQKNLSSTYIKGRIKQILNQEVSVQLGQYNTQGEQVLADSKDIQGYKLSACIYCMRVAVGALVYADSFLILEDQVLVLTQAVPILDFLLTSPARKQFYEEYSKLRYVVPMDIVGRQLKYKDRHDPIPGASLQVGQQDYPGRLKVYQKGMVVDTEQLGYVFMPFQDMNKVVVQSKGIECHYDGDTPVCQSLGLNKITVNIKLHEVISTVVELLKKEGIQYEYGQQYKEEEQDEQMSRMEYLQYRQNSSTTKNNKALSIEQYLQAQSLEIQEHNLEGNINWVVVMARQVEQPHIIGQAIQESLQQNGRKVRLYCQNDSGASLEQEIKEAGREQDGLSNGDILVVALMEGLQHQITNEMVNKAGGRLALRVARLCVGTRQTGDMLAMVRHFLIPGYTQALLVDQHSTTQPAYDAFLRQLREQHPNIILSVNNRFDAAALCTLLVQQPYFSQKQENQRIQYQHLVCSTSNLNYAFMSYRLPIDIDLFIHVMQTRVMQQHNGYVLPSLEFSKYIAEQVDKSNLKDEEQLALQMSQLSTRVQTDDLSGSLLKIDSISALLLGQDNTVVQVILDRYYSSVVVQSHYQISQQQVNVKTRSYEVQVYSPAAPLGITVQGHNLDLLPSLDDLFTQALVPTKTPLLTKQQLSDELIASLEMTYVNYGLEDGEFFDGSFFRDFEGKYLEHHPKKDQLVDKYLKEQNAQVAETNRQKEKEWKLRLYKYKYE